MTNAEAKKELQRCDRCRSFSMTDSWAGECTADGKCYAAKQKAIEALEDDMKKTKTRAENAVKAICEGNVQIYAADPSGVIVVHDMLSEDQMAAVEARICAFLKTVIEDIEEAENE